MVVNPSLCTPDFSKDYLHLDEGVIITKLRTGTHNLYIEADRLFEV